MKNKHNNTTYINNNIKKCRNTRKHIDTKDSIKKHSGARGANKIVNWRAYNEGLVNRGRISIWIDKLILESHQTLPKSHRRGHPKEYSDGLILLALTLKEMFHLTLRSTEGFIKDILKFSGLTCSTPDYSTLCRRGGTLRIPIRHTTKFNQESIHLLVDSTGIKVMGEGEWKIRLHGKNKMKLYRKVHLVVDYASREILGLTMSDANCQDADAVPELLDDMQSLDAHILPTVSSLIADGAYDYQKTYRLTNNLGIPLIAPPEARAIIRHDDPVWKLRNQYVKDCQKLGKEKWKDQVGYYRRNIVENTMFRLKRSFTDEMRARKDTSQLTTMRIRANLLNYFAELGLPRYQLA